MNDAMIACSSSLVRRSAIFVLAVALAANAGMAQTIAPYLEIDGHAAPAPQGMLKHTPAEISASMTARKDGTYRFGIAISSPEIALLGPGTPKYTCESLKERLTVRYPYDWTWRSPSTKGNVLNARPRLIMPGIRAADRLYVFDTRELFSVTLEPCGAGNAIRALLLAHRVDNDGADRATSELKLHKGERADVALQIYPDIAAANRARFGEHNRMQGVTTQPAYREWTTEPLTEEAYDKIGRGLGGGLYQFIVVREVSAPDWIPRALHKHGLLAIAYQYMGALRRHSAQVTPEIQAEIGMTDAKGQLYTAPTALNGNWLLGDIRRPEVRARFVNNARMAVRAGFDGVFLDGYPFWADATGAVGGNVPGATHSLAYARWQLLHEMKQAMREENPKATLGVLSNQYFDSLGEADWCVKERMYFQWDTGNGRTGVKIQKIFDRAFEEDETPYSAGTMGYGAKGFDPIPVQSAIHFVEHPTGLTHTDASDFPERELDQWIETEKNVMAHKDLYVTDIEPAACWVDFPKVGIMETDTPCAVHFSRPLCISEAADRQAGQMVQQISTKPKVAYRLARECRAEPGGKP